MDINSYYYLKNFNNNKFIRIDKDALVEVPSSATATAMGNRNIAEGHLKQWKSTMPHLEIVNEAGSLA